jgi:hypothetical protein
MILINVGQTKCCIEKTQIRETRPGSESFDWSGHACASPVSAISSICFFGQTRQRVDAISATINDNCRISSGWRLILNDLAPIYAGSVPWT